MHLNAKHVSEMIGRKRGWVRVHSTKLGTTWAKRRGGSITLWFESALLLGGSDVKTITLAK